MTLQTDLSRYSAAPYRLGNFGVRALWYLASILFFRTAAPWPNRIKKLILVLFGAQVGSGVVIKPCVIIKYPWFLSLGDHVWIGEHVWIDNLTWIKIADHVCISQGTYLTSGSHDYKKITFDLILKPIEIKKGAWVAARCVINPGVTIGSHSIIASGSVVTKNTDDYMIYAGNPARPAKERTLE